jgi:hypothetical protein
MKKSCGAAWIILLIFSALSFGAKFFEDDPIWVDPDRLSIPKPS